GTPVAVTASYDKTAIVWDLETGTPRHTLTGHSGEVNGVTGAVLPDGTPVAVTASYDKTAIVWDLETGTPRHTLTGHREWLSAVGNAALPDGTPVAVTTGHDKTVIVWDPATGRKMWSTQLPDTGLCVAAIPAGFLIGHGPDIACFLWTDLEGLLARGWPEPSSGQRVCSYSAV
ncbi:PQQ-binding-like beta-propeller repeat protein, partial [Streptomyces sp. NPDC006332]|uniref:PQQ-binding-like beta-propeller repeat protein n=1 Tax=Streptomyces sp. NPDC006332 TaxID=3155456 RepID=UPI0033B3E0D1